MNTWEILNKHPDTVTDEEYAHIKKEWIEFKDAMIGNDTQDKGVGE